MVLSDRFAGAAPKSLLWRTVMYALGFGVGALVVAAGLSFVMVTIAEGLLPAPTERGAAKERPSGDSPLGSSDSEGSERPGSRLKAGSKAGPSRANEAGDSEEDPEPPL
jgi:hypothetical protein